MISQTISLKDKDFESLRAICGSPQHTVKPKNFGSASLTTTRAKSMILVDRLENLDQQSPRNWAVEDRSRC